MDTESVIFRYQLQAEIHLLGFDNVAANAWIPRWAAKSPITANLGTAMQRQDIHLLLLIQIISITAVSLKFPSVTVNSILP